VPKRTGGSGIVRVRAMAVMANDTTAGPR